MQKIKFDFEATKERIYAPNSNVPIGAPVDRNGNIANDGNAYGIVLCKETENEKYWVRYNLVVMVAGYCDIIDAQNIWGDEYSAEAIAAMSDITFCDNHQLPTGCGGGGGDFFIVSMEMNFTGDDGGTLVADKTTQDVMDAIDGGKIVLIKLSGAFRGVISDAAIMADGRGNVLTSTNYFDAAGMLLTCTAYYGYPKWTVDVDAYKLADGDTITLEFTEQ